MQAAAERAAHGPGDAGAGGGFGQTGEVEQGVGRGVPGADDDGVFAGVLLAVGAEDVGQGVVDQVGGLGVRRARAARWRRAGWGCATCRTRR